MIESTPKPPERRASSAVISRRALLGGLGAAALPALVGAAPARAAAAPELLTSPATSDDNVIVPQSASVLPLRVEAAPSQTAHLTEWRRGDGRPNLAIDFDGDIVMPRTPDGMGPFAWRLGGSTFEGLWDPSISFGYNIGNKSGKALGLPTVPGEPYAGFFIESDFDDGAKRTVEQYYEFRAADGKQNIRPLMYQVNRFATTPEAFMTSAQIIGNPLTFSIVRNGAGNDIQPTVDAMNFYANHALFLAPLEGQPNLVSINAGANQRSYLRFGANDVPNQWQWSALSNRLDFVYGTSTHYRFYGTPRGVAGAAFSVGVDDNQAAGVFDTAPSANGVKGLVVRGKSTINANLVEVQNAARQVLSGYDKRGRWFTNRNTAPADADVKQGQMSVWFDAVGGSFRYKARDSKNKIVTGSVPLARAAVGVT